MPEAAVRREWPLCSHLEQHLHTNIPLSRAMQVTVLEADPEHVLLRAPLAPNLNPHGTVFGGSAYTLATLAAWTLLSHRLEGRQPAVSVVLQTGSMQYARPMHGDFTALAQLPADADWPQFLRMLARCGRARLTVAARLQCAGETAGAFSGEFVALTEGLAPGVE